MPGNTWQRKCGIDQQHCRQGQDQIEHQGDDGDQPGETIVDQHKDDDRRRTDQRGSDAFVTHVGTQRRIDSRFAERFRIDRNFQGTGIQNSRPVHPLPPK